MRKWAIIGLLGTGLLLGGWWWLVNSRTGVGAVGGSATRPDAVVDARFGGRLDPSVLRSVSRYGTRGPSHARLELSLRVVRRVGGEQQPVEGATLLVDDEPVGVTDTEGRQRAEIAISDSGEARHVVWAEGEGQRSSPIAFDEEQWPTEEVVLLLAAVGRIEGVVLGDEGRPRAGASVVIHPRLIAPLVSDPEGRFVLEDLPAGRFDLEAWHEASGISTAVVVRRGETTRVALRLAVLSHIRGQVVDEEERPVAGVGVRLRAAVGEPVLAEVMSATDGTFAFAPTFLTRAVVQAQEGLRRAASTVSRPFGAVELVLKRTGVVTGRVRHADGRPALGANVLDANPRIQTGTMDGFASATGPEAIYRLPAVAADVTELFVAPKGQGTYRAVGGLVVIPGEEVTFDLDLPERGRDISGQVQDSETGQGIEGVQLEFTSVTGGRAYTGTNLNLVTDASGAFEIQQTDADFFFVTATHSRYQYHRGRMDPGAPIIELLPGRRVHGRVVDGNHVPLSEFSLQGRGIRDALGRFDRAIDLSLSKVEFSAPRHLSREVVLTGDGPIDLGTVILESVPTVTVSVRMVDGSPAPGATLYRFDSRWSESMAVAFKQLGYSMVVIGATDAEGRARVPRPGERECLGAMLPGQGPSMDPPCGRPTPEGSEVVLELTAPATLVGDAGGPDRIVEVSPEALEVRSDARGQYRLEGLFSGDHTVFFYEPDGALATAARRTITLEAGQTSRLDRNDPSQGAIALTLRGKTDELFYLELARVPEEVGSTEDTLPWETVFGFDGLDGERTVTADGLVAGRTRLRVRVLGKDSEVEVEVQASETVTATLVLPQLDDSDP